MKENQNADSYVMEFKTLAVTWNFRDQETSFICTRIIPGLNGPGLQERLLREPKLTLQDAMNVVKKKKIFQN